MTKSRSRSTILGDLAELEGEIVRKGEALDFKAETLFEAQMRAVKLARDVSDKFAAASAALSDFVADRSAARVRLLGELAAGFKHAAILRRAQARISAEMAKVAGCPVSAKDPGFVRRQALAIARTRINEVARRPGEPASTVAARCRAILAEVDRLAPPPVRTTTRRSGGAR